MNTQTADLLQFLNESPCNFLAVKNITDRLDRADSLFSICRTSGISVPATAIT